MWPSGKAAVFGTANRGFESYHPSFFPNKIKKIIKIFQKFWMFFVLDVFLDFLLHLVS